MLQHLAQRDRWIDQQNTSELSQKLREAGEVAAAYSLTNSLVDAPPEAAPEAEQSAEAAQEPAQEPVEDVMADFGEPVEASMHGFEPDELTNGERQTVTHASLGHTLRMGLMSLARNLLDCQQSLYTWLVSRPTFNTPENRISIDTHKFGVRNFNMSTPSRFVNPRQPEPEPEPLWEQFCPQILVVWSPSSPLQDNNSGKFMLLLHEKTEFRLKTGGNGAFSIFRLREFDREPPFKLGSSPDSHINSIDAPPLFHPNTLSKIERLGGTWNIEVSAVTIPCDYESASGLLRDYDGTWDLTGGRSGKLDWKTYGHHKGSIMPDVFVSLLASGVHLYTFQSTRPDTMAFIPKFQRESVDGWKPESVDGWSPLVGIHESPEVHIVHGLQEDGNEEDGNEQDGNVSITIQNAVRSTIQNAVRSEGEPPRKRLKALKPPLNVEIEYHGISSEHIHFQVKKFLNKRSILALRELGDHQFLRPGNKTGFFTIAGCDDGDHAGRVMTKPGVSSENGGVLPEPFQSIASGYLHAIAGYVLTFGLSNCIPWFEFRFLSQTRSPERSTESILFLGMDSKLQEEASSNTSPADFCLGVCLRAAAEKLSVNFKDVSSIPVVTRILLPQVHRPHHESSQI